MASLDGFVLREPSVSEELNVSIKQIMQDSQGFIWFGTAEGLARYDGGRTVMFRGDPDRDSSLSSSVVVGMVEDSDGYIWIATANNGLNRYNPVDQTFLHYRKGGPREISVLSDSITSISKGASGTIWLGYNEGFSALDANSGIFKHNTVVKYPALKDLHVNDIVEGNGGRIFLGTSSRGLLSLSPGADSESSTLEILSAGALPSVVDDLHVSSDGVILLASLEAGIFSYDPKIGRAHQIPMNGEVRPLNIMEDSQGLYWISMIDGLIAYSPDTGMLRRYGQSTENLAFHRVLTTFEDREGTIWVGTFHGVSTIHRSPVKLIEGNLLPNDHVVSLAHSGEKLWIGTDAGLYTIPHEAVMGEIEYAPEEPLLEESIVTSLTFYRGRVYAGTYSDGMYVLNKNGRVVSHFRHDPLDRSSLSSNAVSQIVFDALGNMWVSTVGGGLNYKLASEDRFTQFRHNSSDSFTINSDRVYTVFVDSSGAVWAGTDKGLAKYNSDTGDFLRIVHDSDSRQGLPGDVVFAIGEDQESRLWIGIEDGGVAVWEAYHRKQSVNLMTRYLANINMPSSTVFSFAPGVDGDMWFGTGAGLTRLNAETGDYRHFSDSYGLQSRDFNINASTKDGNGYVYFGGPNGFNYFDPADLAAPPKPKQVQITKITKIQTPIWFDKPLNQVESVDFEYDVPLIGIEFSAMEYLNPEAINYKYQLIGVDRGWQSIGNETDLMFPGLAHGNYTLLLAVDGPSEANPVTSIGIYKPPPPWRTGTAIAIYALMLAALSLFVLYRFQRSRLLEIQQREELEAKVRDRTSDLLKAQQEAESANKAKSEFMATLSHEIRTPMHGVLGMLDIMLVAGMPDGLRNYARRAAKEGQVLLTLINDILDYSKIEAGKLELERTAFDLEELVSGLCLLHAESAQKKGLDLNLVFDAHIGHHVEGDPVRFQQILQNLINNAIKFTDNGSVTVRVTEIFRRRDRYHLAVSIKDTGIGMTDDALARVTERFTQADASTTRRYGGTGLGLSIAKQLTELMGGQLKINSVPGEGTEMLVDVRFKVSAIEVEAINTQPLESIRTVVIAPKDAQEMYSTCLRSLKVSVECIESIWGFKAPVGGNTVAIIDAHSVASQDYKFITDTAALDGVQVLLVHPVGSDGPEELSHLPSIDKPLRGKDMARMLCEVTGISPDRIGLASEAANSRQLHTYDLKALSVDDSEGNQDIICSMLGSFGSRVDRAANGQEAVEAFRNNHYDVIFMDCQMPVMDGFEATRLIRTLEEKENRKRIPILAVTAGTTEGDRHKCLHAGMDRMLQKPYSVAELNTVLGRFFQQSGVLDSYQVQDLPEEPNLVEGMEDVLKLSAIQQIEDVMKATGNFELLEKIIATYEQDSERHLAALEEAVDDPRQFGKIAHALKSTSLNVGAKQVSELTGELEKAAKNGVVKFDPDVRDTLKAKLQAARTKLRVYLKTESLQ